MKKKYVSMMALVLSVSVGLSAHLALAQDAASPEEEAAAASAAEEAATTEADTSTLYLSLEEAMEYVETGNNEIRLADSKLQILDYQYQQALARKEIISIVDYDSARDKTFNDKSALFDWDVAKHDRKTQLKDLKVEAANEYQNILIYRQQAANYDEQIANLQTKIDEINLQIELGLMIPATIYAYEAQKSGLEAQQKGILGSIDSSMITLKQSLGIDLSRNVVLTSNLRSYTKYDDGNVNNLMAKAIENHYDFQKYERDIELTYEEYRLADRYEDSTANSLELSVDDKKGTLANLATELEAGYRTAYIGLKSLESTIEANKLTLEADQINIDVKQKSIDVGKATTLELIDLQNTLLSDQLTLEQNINSYLTAVANFENSLDQ